MEELGLRGRNAMTENSEDRTARIRELNDELRCRGAGGKMVVTAGVVALGEVTFGEIVDAVKTFDAFGDRNDPHQEHDFGNFDLCGRSIFWKIDYYDQELERGSDDPANPEKTARVLTIMLAEEY
jgi:hypothetical protein